VAITIKKFQFTDKESGWTLNETEFSHFNLLVGVSGVGKTRVLEAIGRLRNLILDLERGASRFRVIDRGCKWKIVFQSKNEEIIWSAETASLQNEDGSFRRKFLAEKIVIDGVDIVDRKEEDFLFEGNRLPRLSDSESSVILLARESSLYPIRCFLYYLIHEEHAEFSRSFDETSFNKFTDDLPKIYGIKSIPLLVSSGLNSRPFLITLYILQEQYPETYQQIKEDFLAIFNSVEDIKIGLPNDFEPFYPDTLHKAGLILLHFGIKENGKWIIGNRISLGMRRTLYYLFELALAPHGTVFLIDEIENSMGVNCLPQLMDIMLRHSNDFQFIITSHHPYVINNIPLEYWKIVQRDGSNVTIRDASSIPALQTKSLQDKFLLLTNSKEYEEGIR